MAIISFRPAVATVPKPDNLSYRRLLRAMTVSRTRAMYRGMLPNSRSRSLGGYALYVSLGGAFEFTVKERSWVGARVAVALPHEVHSIHAPNPVLALLFEEETVELSLLPSWMQLSGAVGDRALISQLRASYEALPRNFQLEESPAASDLLDTAFFGEVLPARVIQARVMQSIDRIIEGPAEIHAAEDCAAEVNLSASRFLHLFKDETGVPFRRFKAWKRARAMLSMCNWSDSLTDMAIDSGYADSAHFSNSIREAFGFSPSYIVESLKHVATHYRETVRFFDNVPSLQMMGHK